MEVSKLFVQKWYSDWQKYWLTLDHEGKECFGVESEPPSADLYLRCNKCNGSYKNMAMCLDSTSVNGKSVSGIMNRDEKWD